MKLANTMRERLVALSASDEVAIAGDDGEAGIGVSVVMTRGACTERRPRALLWGDPGIGALPDALAAKRCNAASRAMQCGGDYIESAELDVGRCALRCDSHPGRGAAPDA